MRNPPPRLRRYSPQRSLTLAGRRKGGKTRRPRGSIGRSLNPLGALDPCGVRPGTQLHSGVSPGPKPRRALTGLTPIRRPVRSGDRSPPLPGRLRIRRSAGQLTARRSRRIPVRPVGHPYRGGSSRSGFRLSVPTVRDAAGSPLWRDGQRRPPPMSWQTRIAIRFRDLRLLFATGPRGVHRADTRRPIKPRTRENPEGAPAEAAALSGLPGHSPGKRAPGR